MCEVLAIYKQKSNFLGVLRQQIKENEKSLQERNVRATSIQRVWRGNRARTRIYIQNCAATEIERVHRGHMGRKRSRHQLKKKNESRLLSMFYYFAIQLQRSFRGYYSRKYRHNFFQRKNYIQELVAKGEEVRDRLSEYNRTVAEREFEEEERNKDETFKKHAENLHHLVSTRRMRGVFNPPEEYLNIPTLHDIAVEDHIRGAVKDLLRSKGITKTGLVTDIHGSRKVPLKGLKNRLSVQASAPYDSLKIEKQQTMLLHKLLTKGKGTFFCGGKTNVIDKVTVPPMCVGDTFVDAWGNPLMQRGVPVSQQQLNASAYTRKPLFVTHQDRPFYTRAEGNKSATMPNDIFDVIAEAEEFGGAAQRHMGTSQRFGLPTSADNRPPEGNGTIPPPPLRTSTIKYAKNPAVKKTKTMTRPAAVVERSQAEGAENENGESSPSAPPVRGMQKSYSKYLSVYDDSSDDERP